MELRTSGVLPSLTTTSVGALSTSTRSVLLVKALGGGWSTANLPKL